MLTRSERDALETLRLMLERREPGAAATITRLLSGELAGRGPVKQKRYRNNLARDGNDAQEAGNVVTKPDESRVTARSRIGNDPHEGGGGEISSFSSLNLSPSSLSQDKNGLEVRSTGLVRLTDSLPDELREAAKMAGMQAADIDAVWLAFVGHYDGQVLPSVAGRWQSWVAREVQRSRRLPPGRVPAQPTGRPPSREVSDAELAPPADALTGEARDKAVREMRESMARVAATRRPPTNAELAQDALSGVRGVKTP